jgi:hypothetical protein
LLACRQTGIFLRNLSLSFGYSLPAVLEKEPFKMGSEVLRRMLFEVLSHVDPNVVGPRLGRLRIQGRKDLETPGFMAISSRGVVPHISPDVLAANTQVGGVHIALEDCKSLDESRVHILIRD